MSYRRYVTRRCLNGHRAKARILERGGANKVPVTYRCQECGVVYSKKRAR